MARAGPPARERMIEERSGRDPCAASRTSDPMSHGGRQRQRRVLAVDTGGTFTDLVLLRGRERSTTLKVPSTPADPAQAVLDGVRQAPGRGAAPSSSSTAPRWPPTPSWSAGAPGWCWSPTRASRTSSRSAARTGPSSTLWWATGRRPWWPGRTAWGSPGRLGPRGEEVEPLDPDGPGGPRHAGAGARRRVRGRLPPPLLRRLRPRAGGGRRPGRHGAPPLGLVGAAPRVPGVRAHLHHGGERLRGAGHVPLPGPAVRRGRSPSGVTHHGLQRGRPPRGAGPPRAGAHGAVGPGRRGGGRPGLGTPGGPRAGPVLRHGRHLHRRVPVSRASPCAPASSTSTGSPWPCRSSTSTRWAPAAAPWPGWTPAARCGSVPRAPAPTPAPSATAGAARASRSPTPTSGWDGFRWTPSWAERGTWTATP